MMVRTTATNSTAMMSGGRMASRSDIGGSPSDGSHEREQDRLPDVLTGQRHEDPVDAGPHAAGRRHRVLERPQEVLVERHRLGVPAGGEEGLLGEPGAL